MPEQDYGRHIETLRKSRLSPEGTFAVGALAKEIARLRQENEQLKLDKELLGQLVYIDRLTGIGNMRALERKKTQLEQVMRSEHRRGDDNPPYAVVVASADLIGLKRFNQEHSPAVGDEAIRVVAQSMSDPFREDEWFRRGGDEFIGLMPVDDAEGIQKVIEKLKSGPPTVYEHLHSALLPKKFPVLCAVRVFQPGGNYRSLDEAELAADPKTAGKKQIISFSS